MIDRLSPMPLYAQLADELAAAIDAGKWNDGDRLPTRVAGGAGARPGPGHGPLGDQAAARAGLAYTIQARGTFVGRPPQAQ